MDISNKCEGLAVGVRFNPNFHIEDKLGAIVDKILYVKDSTFNPALFTKVYTNNGEKILANEVTGDQLRISNTEVVLDIKSIKDQSEIMKYIKRFKVEIIEYLFKEINLKGVMRLGILRRYSFDEKSMINKFIATTLGENFKDSEDIQLRFSSNISTPNALIKADVNDYLSAIYTIVKNKINKNLLISLDYQIYYKPPVDKVYQLSYDEFVDSNEKYIDNGFKEWLNKYFEVENNG